MRLFHQFLVYFGLRKPRLEDEASWVLADPAPWWRLLLAAVIVIALLAVLAWVFTGNFGETRSIAAVVVAVTLAGVGREELERRRRRRDAGGAGPSG